MLLGIISISCKVDMRTHTGTEPGEVACGLSASGAAGRRNGSLEKGLVTPQRTAACEAESESTI